MNPEEEEKKRREKYREQNPMLFREEDDLERMERWDDPEKQKAWEIEFYGKVLERSDFFPDKEPPEKAE